MGQIYGVCDDFRGTKSPQRCGKHHFSTRIRNATSSKSVKTKKKYWRITKTINLNFINFYWYKLTFFLYSRAESVLFRTLLNVGYNTFGTSTDKHKCQKLVPCRSGNFVIQKIPTIEIWNQNQRQRYADV